MAHLIDTNIVIYYFNGLTDDEAIHRILAGSFKISVITKIEFLGWGQFATDPESQTKAREFISMTGVGSKAGGSDYLPTTCCNS